MNLGQATTVATFDQLLITGSVWLLTDEGDGQIIRLSRGE